MMISEPVISPNILVVEDDAENGRLFELTLASAGYNVTRVTTVKDAVQIIEEQPLDLVTVDWYLPDGTAATVCEAVQQQNRKTPVILITGQADLRTIQIENSQIDRWLNKPTTPQKLLTAVAQLLGDDPSTTPDSTTPDSLTPET